MRLSVLHLALVLGAFALPATAMSQQPMPVQAGGQSVMVNQGAAMPVAYGQPQYCPPGYGNPGMYGHHHQPRLPAYAGPAYGTNPHYGAMTYPLQQAPAVWPYSGSYYPYPQIPPGWKKVALEWDDGYWYLDFKSHKNPKHH